VDSKGIQPFIYICPFSSKLPSRPGCHKTMSRVLEGATKILKDGTIIFSGFRKKCLFLRDVIAVELAWEIRA